jgi:hypothetical protein
MCSVLRGVSRQVARAQCARSTEAPATVARDIGRAHCALSRRNVPEDLSAPIRAACARWCHSGAQSSGGATPPSPQHGRHITSSAGAGAAPKQSETIQNVIDSDDVSKLLAPRDTAATLLIDTLKLMKEFEGNGLNRQQAEALTRHLTEIILSQVRNKVAYRCAVVIVADARRPCNEPCCSHDTEVAAASPPHWCSPDQPRALSHAWH